MSQSTVGGTADNLDLDVARNADAELPAQEIVTGRGLIAGTSGAGKSNTATVVAEEVLELGVPLAVIDPEGEFSALSEEYPIVVFGADPDADVSGDATDANELARRAVAERIPVVFDLSGFVEAETHSVAGAVATGLFHAEKQHEVPYLLIADEIDEYLPNKAKTDATKPLSRVAQRGRKRGLGLLGLSQRPADVSKDFVTQAEYHIWHRFKWENDADVAENHLPDGYTVEFTEFEDGEVVLSADWNETPERFSVRFKTVSDLGATPSIARSLGSVPEDVPADLLGSPEESSGEPEALDSHDAADSCTSCAFCAAGIEPPAHMADAATVENGTVLGVYQPRETREGRYRIEIDDPAVLRDELGVSAGDTVGVTVTDQEVRLNPNGDGLRTYTVTEDGESLSLVLSNRALDCLAVELNDLVRVVDRTDRVTLERVTGRNDAIQYPVLGTGTALSRKDRDTDQAHQVCLPKNIPDYLGIEMDDGAGRVGVKYRDGDVYLCKPDEGEHSYAVRNYCPAIGLKTLREIDARGGDTLVVRPDGPETALLTKRGDA